MRRLIRKSELYSGQKIWKVNDVDYLECFINPSYNEFEAAEKIYTIRAFLLEDGTLYIFPGLIDHNDAKELFNIPPSLHLFIMSKNKIGIYPEVEQDAEYIKNAFVNSYSLYNWINKNTIVDYLDPKIYGAPSNKLYKKIKTISDIETIL